MEVKSQITVQRSNHNFIVLAVNGLSLKVF